MFKKYDIHPSRTILRYQAKSLDREIIGYCQGYRNFEIQIGPLDR